MKVVFIGGHHSSAIPILEELRRRELAIEPFWIGHRHSLSGDTNDTLEYTEICALGIPFFELHTGKVFKTTNFLSIARIFAAIVISYQFLKRTKPDLIMSFGGYLAAPVVIAGWILGIPILTHEQTTVTGYANRLISLFADKVFISWIESRRYFPADKVIFSGLPLREAVFKPQAKVFTSDNNLPTVFVLAGKSGSVKINNVIAEALADLLQQCNLIHQCGNYSQADSYEKLSMKYEEIKAHVPGNYFLRKFILAGEIGSAYQCADLVIARSGAHTVAEILALKKPALFVPIAWVSHNEQENNAKLVKNTGLAEILPESQLTAQNLIEKIKYMVHNLSTYKNTLPSNQAELSANASGIILSEILKYAPKSS